jgi:probable blue pigment (indigoidine) exporter
VRRRNVLFLALAALCWAAGTVVSKQAVAEVPPLTLLPLQLAVSVAFLLVVARVRGVQLPSGRDGRLLGRLGLLNPGLAYALSLVGLTQISASLSVLLWALEPILILGLAALVLSERLRPSIVVASAIAIVGLGLVVFDPLASGSALGIALTAAGVGVCAIYTVAARAWLPGTNDSTLGVVLAQQAYALGLAIAVLAGLALAGWPVLPATVSAGAAISAAASGLLYYAFAYLFYLSALRTVRASVASAAFYLIPVFGVSLGWLAGERLEPVQWVGGAIVVAAVAAIAVRAAGPLDAAQPSRAAASAQIATTPSD